MDCKSRGIGIILSGTGSDGTSGCRAIRSQGGMTFAQDPMTAAYGGMPSFAMAAGAIDQVSHQSDLPAQILARLSRQKAVPATPALEEILRLVMLSTGTDFSGYKEETLLRRLEQRKSALKIPSTENYLLHLRQYPAELINLQHAFLVSLSSFFRDRASFQTLRQELQRVAQHKESGGAIRIWVPGCASGEEVYTLAIILAEILADRIQDFEISLTGTDLNPEALARAGAGIYEPRAFKEMDASFLERYFYPQEKSWQVKSWLRNMCRFECCDVLRHAPLQELDLISCRNLLIYLKTDTQEQLLQKFHDYLLPHGLLFLGQSESVSISGKAPFVPVHGYYRIFSRR
jgi:chemotaxis protein methyltransferase CheR/two-component system CheB/CheR fusion protein